MIGMQEVFLGQSGAQILPLDQLEHSHGITAKSARMYTRFFGQTGVRLCGQTHRTMLLEVLTDLITAPPYLRDADGYGIYTKTQTHNTFF